VPHEQFGFWFLYASELIKIRDCTRSYYHSTEYKAEKKFIIDDKLRSQNELIAISTTTGHAVSFSSVPRTKLTELPTHVKGA